MCGYQLVYNALQPCFVKCMYSAVGHLYKQGSTSPTSGVKRLDKQNRHGLAVAVPACWNRMLQLTYKYCSNNVLRPSAGDMAAPYPVPEDPKTTRKSLGQFWKDTRQARRDNPQDKSLVAPGLQQYQGAVTWPRSGRLTCMLHCNRQSRSSRFLSRGMGHAPHCSGPVLSVPSDPYHCNSHRGQTSARQRP